eukprot:CAMPEP_0204261138 /NCGR_PEP_ID=MMETSP0468-20130131/6800_1 /ASSEMBLY_ACC=CAM_ASM_000383 /TAXON_ID=2969 /ORGANISM="Oxyrrhis marina" /LENGTH=243 /DNA_ID=CAMNT_0051235649 /DNA_START=46 /DNA_END=779 /DNA_ORIENTATION=-
MAFISHGLKSDPSASSQLELASQGASVDWPADWKLRIPSYHLGGGFWSHGLLGWVQPRPHLQISSTPLPHLLDAHLMATDSKPQQALRVLIHALVGVGVGKSIGLVQEMLLAVFLEALARARPAAADLGRSISLNPVGTAMNSPAVGFMLRVNRRVGADEGRALRAPPPEEGRAAAADCGRTGATSSSAGCGSASGGSGRSEGALAGRGIHEGGSSRGGGAGKCCRRYFILRESVMIPIMSGL